MTFTVGFKARFAVEFTRFQPDQRGKIRDFIRLYQQVGLVDFSKYEGKITPSWSGLATTDPDYNYTTGNSLWHYHIGLPSYSSVHPAYKTSDWVLHFQWHGRGDRIDLVDLYQHRTSMGKFYLPPADYLVDPDVADSDASQASS